MSVPAPSRRLRLEADQLEAGWRPHEATMTLEGAASPVALAHHDSQYRPLVLVPQQRKVENAEVEYTIPLDLPQSVQGVAWDGSPLELYIISNFPTRIRVGDRVVLEDAIPLVAAGPAKLTLLEDPRPGDNGDLRVTVRTGRGEVDGVMAHTVLALHFGTPAITHAFRALDVAAARLDLASALASTQDEARQVQACCVAVEAIPGPLVHALDDVEAALAPLAQILNRAQDYEVMCIGHSHIDLSWLWDWEDARAVQRRDLRSVADLMDDYPEFRFTHSQPAGYRAVQQLDPELFERIRQLVAEGRLEPATMQWVESDTNVASGPASARQILEAVRWSRAELGVSPDVHLAPDTFGHAGNLPQLSRSGGATVYYHHRANPGLAAGGELWPAYWWESDDGTRLLAISTPVYLGALTAGRVVADLIRFGIAQNRAIVCYFFGVGDHGGGPTRDDLDFLRLMAGREDFPRVACRTVAQYRDAILESGEELPVHRGESMTVFEGCYISHSDAKRANRQGENALVSAEALGAIARVERGAWVGEAWRTVLFNQFHDIAGGSAIRVVYEDLAVESETVLDVARELTDRALDVLECGHEGSWVVTNPSAEPRADAVVIPGPPQRRWIMDEHGSRYPVQRTSDGASVFVATFAPFETRAFGWPDDDRDGAREVPTESVESNFYEGLRLIAVETERYRYQIRSDSGIVTTLFDKRSGREYVSFGEGMGKVAVQARPDLGLGVLQVIDEKPHIMTAWVADEFYREESLVRDARVEIVERGTVRIVLECRHRVRSSTVVVRLAIYAELDRLEYDIDIDWREVGDDVDGLASLAIAFGARLGEVEARYETPYSSARRPADGRIVPGLRWADLSNADAGIAVLNDGRYGHETLGSRTRLHLARGSYDPDAMGDVGRERVRVSLLPHEGGWRDAGLVSAATSLNAPLIVRPVDPQRARRARPQVWRPSVTDAPGVHLTEVKPGEEGGVVLRLVESLGEPAVASIALPDGVRAWRGSVVEDLLEVLELSASGDLELVMRPHEVCTVVLREVAEEETTG